MRSLVTAALGRLRATWPAMSQQSGESHGLFDHFVRPFRVFFVNQFRIWVSYSYHLAFVPLQLMTNSVGCFGKNQRMYPSSQQPQCRNTHFVVSLPEHQSEDCCLEIEIRYLLKLKPRKAMLAVFLQGRKVISMIYCMHEI